MYDNKVLPPSLEHIKTKLSADKNLRPSQIVNIIKEAQVKAEELMPWADFEHPVADGYGRKLVHHGGHFEIMVMSWVPGDFAAIHDHGYTQWGAVQIFGPAEHATFRVDIDQISTLARWTVTPGDVVGVNHDLVHQMGNLTADTRFLSLHVYGQLEHIESVTGDARIFDLQNENIQRVDGGVFFALPPNEIKRTQAGPKGDFPTRLRHMVEHTKRLLRITQAGETTAYSLETAIEDTFSKAHRINFEATLQEDLASKSNSYWKILNRELEQTALLIDSLKAAGYSHTEFDAYLDLQDLVDSKQAAMALA